MNTSDTNHRRGGVLTALLVYLAIQSANFFPDVRAKQAAAFGPAPFGLPLALVMVLGVTILLLPFFVSVYHFYPIVIQAVRDGRSTGKFSILLYLFQVGRRHPHLRGSQRWAVLGLLDLIAVAGGWAVYAEALGI